MKPVIGQDGFTQMEEMVGGFNLVTSPPPGASEEYIVISSYNWCYRHQTDIDLLTKGFSQAQLDSLPDIHTGAWIKNWNTSPDWYRIQVTLKDASFQIIDSWDTGQVQNTTVGWSFIHHTFSGYGTPVRYITYENWGKDVEYWGNQSGIVFDEAFVNILNVP